MKTMPDFIVRAAGASDLDGFKELRGLAGPGFTSFQVGDDALQAMLQKSEKSFARDVAAPGEERYLLTLESLDAKQVAGSAGVKATIGATPPFFNFRVLNIAQASAAAKR
ncbi:MAG: arginine N-succinyltransferase, partial [Caulobacterales bacterium]